MALSTSLLRTLSLVLFYFLLTTHQASALRRTAIGVVPTPANTTDAASAADGKMDTAALLQPGVTSPAVERVQFSSVVPAGSSDTGLSMRINNVLSNVLMAAVLDNITIKTYLNGVPKGTWQASKLINLNLLNPGQQTDVVLSPAATADFDQIELSAGSAVSAYSVSLFEAFSPSPAPLPVQLVSFAGQASGGGVQLNWQTASELNSHAFVVERAAAAQAEFVVLGEVAAAGNSAQARRYQFLDARARAGTSYYRLRQVDADGQTHFSPVVAVQASPGPALAAYPSPTAASLTVACPSATPAALYDAQGRLVRQLALAAGVQTLDIQHLKAGVYYLREDSAGRSVRFVKVP